MGLKTADDKQVVRNETLLNKKGWPSSEHDWKASGKGKPYNYAWIPAQKGDKGYKGKKGDKSKKGDQKGKKGDGK